VPPPQERRVRLGLGEWVQDWPCDGGRPSRAWWVRQPTKPPLEVLWRRKIGKTARFPPVVSKDGVIYAADGEGQLAALEAGYGDPVGSLRTSPIGEGSPVWPLVAQGLVPADAVPVSSPPAISGWQLLFGDDEGIFYCVRRGDGLSTWRKAAPLSLAGRSDRAYQAPLVVDDVVYTVDADGNLYGVDPRGKRTLNLYLRGRPTAAPAYANGQLLVATSPVIAQEACKLHAVAPSGSRTWHRDLPSRAAALALSRERAFCMGRFGVLAFGLARGERQWTAKLPWGGAPCGNLALDTRRLYVPCPEGLHVFDQASGKLLWSAEHRKADAVTGVTCAGGAVWVAAGRSLLAWETTSGAALGSARAPGPVAGAPVLALGRMFLITTQGEVAALG
jgi:outer membrane protein assembly factor BamB